MRKPLDNLCRGVLVQVMSKITLMITITEDKLIIELEHPVPEEFMFDLKQGIIDSIQAQDPQAVNREELQRANNSLLELLRSII